MCKMTFAKAVLSASPAAAPWPGELVTISKIMPANTPSLLPRETGRTDNDNGGHFAGEGTHPDFISTWPVHCVAGTEGAKYHPDLATDAVAFHVKKGQGVPSYSMFEGTTDEGHTVEGLISSHSISEVDVVGLATDHCVRASALDARKAGVSVRVLRDLVAAVSPVAEESALEEMSKAGITFA